MTNLMGKYCWGRRNLYTDFSTGMREEKKHSISLSGLTEVVRNNPRQLPRLLLKCYQYGVINQYFLETTGSSDTVKGHPKQKSIYLRELKLKTVKAFKSSSIITFTLLDLIVILVFHFLFFYFFQNGRPLKIRNSGCSTRCSEIPLYKKCSNVLF